VQKTKFIALLLVSHSLSALKFDKVVLWGHKLHSHTHSYIHWGFSRAFKHLGYKVYWLDSKDNLTNIDFSNALFITEGQVDDGIPLRNDAFYILHNCTSKKYQPLFEKNRCIILQVYTHDCKPRKLEVVDDYILCNVLEKIIYMPWATDLLPHEIEDQKKKINLRNRKNEVYFIGTIGGGKFGNAGPISSFRRACKENGIQFKTACKNKSMEDNIRLIRQSYLAPSIQGPWQCKQGYIPCRIFKNISYGHIGGTNNETVYKLFKKKILYSRDTYKLFYDMKRKMETISLSELHSLMDLVKDKHTYLNRIQVLLDFFDRVRAQ